MDIAISADASDGDGTISKVEFFTGRNKLGEATTSPYSITWSNVPAGGYSLYAIATDNTGVTASSLPVLITVYSGNGEVTPVNFKIAFIGDQGLNPNSVAVLNLIKAEGAQAVMHQGDFG